MKYANVVRGKQNRDAGAAFEELILLSCNRYRAIGIADIEKVPEPMRVIQSLGAGKFIAVFAKKAQPDFMGTLKGGTTIRFDAKNTMGGTMADSVVSSEQRKKLAANAFLGGRSYILASFSLERFFRVPWGIWANMKEVYGRKYITPEDVEQYEVTFQSGILDFLPELRDRKE